MCVCFVSLLRRPVVNVVANASRWCAKCWSRVAALYGGTTRYLYEPNACLWSCVLGRLLVAGKGPVEYWREWSAWHV